jgi:hypothetical protein
MSLAVFTGAPGANFPFPAGGATVTLGLELGAGALWQSHNGWTPVSDAYVVNNQLSIAAEIATQTITVPKTGLYRVVGLVVATVATSGTMPTVSVVYTDADAATTQTDTLLTGGSTSAAGTTVTGSIIVNVKAGGTIVISGASYATTTYSAKFRVEYLG